MHQEDQYLSPIRTFCIRKACQATKFKNLQSKELSGGNYLAADDGFSIDILCVFYDHNWKSPHFIRRFHFFVIKTFESKFLYFSYQFKVKITFPTGLCHFLDFLKDSNKNIEENI